MACDDRQLTEAQRVAGYQNQRTGVQQAVRPFSGRPTLENLIDYINRELQPAVRRTRDAVNDVYLQVADNAPSGNPLAYYFSAETAAADPTVGRIRLDASPQNTATTIRISQTNARLADVTPWLDVMAGSSTTPLGVVTLSDAINPGRAIRFDLGTMTDQGDYWDLGVTVIESTHPDPFVEDEAVVLAFIPGVASTGTTVPPGALTPIGANTVLGNPTASTAAPTEIAIGTNTVLGRKTGNIVAETVATDQIGDNQVTDAKLRQGAAMSVIGRSTATTGNVADIAMPVTTGGRFLRTNTTGFPSTNPTAPTIIGWGVITLLDLPILLNNRFLANVSGSDASPVGVDFFFVADGSRGLEWDPIDQVFFVKTNNTLFVHTDGAVEREAITGDIEIAQFSNTAAFRSFTALSVLARAANSSGVPTELSAVAGSGAVLRESGSALSFGTIATDGLADDSVTNDKLAEMAANTVKANATSSTANPTDFAVGANTVLGRVAADIVSAQLVNAQITDGTIANAKLANMVARTVKGRADSAGTGVPTDLTGAQVGAIIRLGNEIGDTTTTGTVATYTVASGTNIVTFNGVTNTIHGFSAPTELGQFLRVQHIGSGTTTLVNQSASAGAAADRMRFANFAADTSPVILGSTGRQTATFVYHGARWVWYGSDGPAENGVLNSELRDSGALSVIGRSANSSGDPADISATAASDAVLRESGSVLGFGTVATAGIANDAVTDAKLRNSAALSVIGRAANSTGDPADIAAANDGEVLRRSGTTLGFGTIATAGIADDSVSNTKLANMVERRIKGRADSAGTGDPQDLTGAQVGSIIRFNTDLGDATTTGSVAEYAINANTNIVTFNGVTNTIHGISIPGETGQMLVMRHIGAGTTTLVQESSTATAAGNRLNLGSFSANTSAIVLGTGRAHQAILLQYFGSRWQRVDNAIADLAIATANVIDDAVTDAKLRNSGACSVIGRSANSSGDPADISAATNDRVLTRASDSLAFRQISNDMIADGTIALGKIAGIGANTVIGNDTGSTTNPTTISVGTNTVLGRVAGNIVAAQLATGQIADDAVTDGKLRNGAALSVIGRSANSTGDVADIAAANDGEVLRRSGTTLGFGTVATAGIAANAVTNARLAQMSQSSIKGRAESAGTGDPQDLTSTQVAAIIDGEPFTWLNDHNFTEDLRADSTFRLNGILTSASTAANDLAIGAVNVVRFTGPIDPLTGMVAALASQTVLLINAHASTNMAIHLESASSSDANRFAGIGTSRVIRPGEMGMAWYDNTSNRWRLLLRDDSDL